MCGIAGLITNSFFENNLEQIKKLWNCMNHRGPDDQGCLVFQNNESHLSRELKNLSPAPGALFFHKRLSILELIGYMKYFQLIWGKPLFTEARRRSYGY